MIGIWHNLPISHAQDNGFACVHTVVITDSRIFSLQQGTPSLPPASPAAHPHSVCMDLLFWTFHRNFLLSSLPPALSLPLPPPFPTTLGVIPPHPQPHGKLVPSPPLAWSCPASPSGIWAAHSEKEEVEETWQPGLVHSTAGWLQVTHSNSICGPAKSSLSLEHGAHHSCPSWPRSLERHAATSWDPSAASC
jgi:hypothetical protein